MASRFTTNSASWKTIPIRVQCTSRWTGSSGRDISFRDTPFPFQSAGLPKKYYRVKPEGAAVLKESFEKSKRKMEAVPNSFWRFVKWPSVAS
jgi:hypothetical protein